MLWQSLLVVSVKGQCWVANQVVKSDWQIRSPTKFLVCGEQTFLNIHCLDFLQYTWLKRASPVNDKEYNNTENMNEDLIVVHFLSPINILHLSAKYANLVSC